MANVGQAFNGLASAGSELIDSLVKRSVGGQSILSSNSPISAIGSNMLGGLELGARLFNPETAKTAVADTFKRGDQWNLGKIAGSYIGASAAFRVASGGGIYRDQHGNPNLIGLPFV